MTTPVLHTARLGAARAAPRVDIDRILHPRSVAVLGASGSKQKFGGRIMSFLVQHGFAGDVYPNWKRVVDARAKRLFHDSRYAPSEAYGGLRPAT